MNRKELSDDFLYDALNKGTLKERDQALAYLFKLKSLRATVFKVISNSGGNQQDLEDLFVESLMLLENNIQNNKFRRTSEVKTYFVGICRNRWLTLLRKKQRVKLEPDAVNFEKYKDKSSEAPFYTQLIRDERNNNLGQLLSKFGERCKTVLMKNGMSFSHKEIAEELGTTPEAIKQAIKNCRNKLRKFINEKGLHNQLKIS